MKRTLKQLAASFAIVALLGCNSTAKAADKDLVDTAIAAGSFKTLAAALDAADLVGALKGSGPFTVFAPTDEAFSKLPAGTVESLLRPENKEQLVAVLTYHVVPGRVAAKQVVELTGAKTLNGQRVDIAISDGNVAVDQAKVVATDINCANGIIHVLDSVILPAGDNIVETATKAGSFKTLLAAAKAAGLADALAGEGPLTVFAPTDQAFAKLSDGTVEALLRPENKSKLAAILKYHVVPGRVYSEDALAAKEAKTLQGSNIRISVSGANAKINDANLMTTDLDASNGVIHVIDSVILPPEKFSAARARKMIEEAVARGARTFNAGHHQACADIYMSTMRERAAGGEQMPRELVATMNHVLAKAQNTDCPTQRSWTLRHGLNHAYARMAALQ